MNITKETGIINGSRDRNRELVRIRDNHTCQNCGRVWKKGERRFDIHHKDCDDSKTRKTDNLEIELDNMITLYHKCHLSLPEHKQKMSDNYNPNRKKYERKKIDFIYYESAVSWYKDKNKLTNINDIKKFIKNTKIKKI